MYIRYIYVILLNICNSCMRKKKIIFGIYKESQQSNRKRNQKETSNQSTKSTGNWNH